jgi:hypothetical protein
MKTASTPHLYPQSDPKVDAQDLHKAGFKGIGTDESVIIRILGNRNKQQLQQINEEFKNQSAKSETLEDAIRKDFGSTAFGTLCLGVLTPVISVKKKTLHDAVVGLGTRENILIDVLTQSSSYEIMMIASDEKLKKSVIDDVGGDFKRTIEEIFKALRPDFGGVEQKTAEEIAHAFYKAGEGKLGTDERKYIEILTHHSLEALTQVDAAYKAKHKHGLKKAISSETSGNFKRILKALVTPKYEYFAQRCYEAIAGAGTDDKTLIYIFSVLEKGDLKEVAKLYKETFRESLQEAIKGDTSHHFCKLFLTLLD